MRSRAGEKIQSGKCLLSKHEGLTPAQTPAPIRMAAYEGTRGRDRGSSGGKGWLATQIRAPD